MTDYVQRQECRRQRLRSATHGKKRHAEARVRRLDAEALAAVNSQRAILRIKVRVAQREDCAEVRAPGHDTNQLNLIDWLAEPRPSR
jgi:hypothetical protein